MSFLSIGTGDGSDVINTRTKGSAPVIPDASKLIEGSERSVTLHLNSWGDGGCPIEYFIVKYRGKYVFSVIFFWLKSDVLLTTTIFLFIVSSGVAKIGLWSTTM